MIKDTLLIELGTEELPPKALRLLASSLCNSFKEQLDSLNLNYSQIKYYATPRRLALLVSELDQMQEDSIKVIKGPSLKVAYDESNKPTNAALGWAKNQGISIDEVLVDKENKNPYIYIEKHQKGQSIDYIVPQILVKSLDSLPIPKLMHWSDKKEEFVRPVHTLCVMYGAKVIDCTVLGIKSSNIVKGHRFLKHIDLIVDHANNYLNILKEQGLVIADYDERKQLIKDQIIKLADENNAKADLDDALLEEVTSLVELPVPYVAQFDEDFLSVPPEALIYTMKGDQKYFPLFDQNGKLIRKFIFVSNINPSDPSNIISGNERVIRPRLSDAKFFFESDRKHKLEGYFDILDTVIYQKDIGTIAFRSKIVEQVATYIGKQIGADATLCSRAAYLAKCDLVTNLVTEFTDLQGIAGYHYALLDGEDKSVALAIKDQYLPKFAGDEVPNDKVAIALSLAEKIVTLVSIFGINMLPKGDKDPFGLRRAAIGMIRIILENKLSLNLKELIEYTASLLSDKLKNDQTRAQVYEFIYNRLKFYYTDKGVLTDDFILIRMDNASDLYDFELRLMALIAFKKLPEFDTLSKANKRIDNILQKSSFNDQGINESLFEQEQESVLFQAINKITPELEILDEQGQYQELLTKLAALSNPIDSFFDAVMVNSDNEAIRCNRLSLLSHLKSALSMVCNI